MSEEQGETVVNCEHLMVHVDEQREAGNAAFKKRQYTEALDAWQLGLDALAQAEGKPMRAADVLTVQRALVTLRSNRGQALLSMEFWRRAVIELDEALSIDPTNAKALWRRHQCHTHLKAWTAAEADLEAMLSPEVCEAAGPLLASAGLEAEKLEKLRAELKEKRLEEDRIAEETFEERAEQTAANGVEKLRNRFEEVTRRNGLRSAELSGELADMIIRPDGVTAQLLAATYQIDDDDADVLLKWAQAACKMRDELGYQGLDSI